MLVLNRKIGERIVIGESIVLTVVKVQGRQVRLGIEAPPSVSIRRMELDPRDEPAPTSFPHRRQPIEAGL
ncbi:MAG: carbon storage regulator [Gemmataceae bacterium]|nr:carbon storage regulator [Gemmataceae bacterium]